MAQNITLQGASYTDVPAVNLPKTGGGQATFTDVTPTTAADSDVASGKIYFKSDGSQSVGTAASGTAAISVVTNQLSGGGEEKVITALDISDTTAVAGDVASGKYFYTAAGVKTQGTASGGGGTWEDPLIPISISVTGTYATKVIIVGDLQSSGTHASLATSGFSTAVMTEGQTRTVYIPRFYGDHGVLFVTINQGYYELRITSLTGATLIAGNNMYSSPRYVIDCESGASVVLQTYNNN